MSRKRTNDRADQIELWAEFLSMIVLAAGYGAIFAAFCCVLRDNIPLIAAWGFWDFFAAYFVLGFGAVGGMMKGVLYLRREIDRARDAGAKP